MRKYVNYAIFILPFFFTNCHRGGPCDNGGEVICVGVYYGSTKLNDSTDFWIPNSFPQNIAYTSGAPGGSILSCALNGSTKKVAFKDVLFSHTEQRTCGTALCEDYCNSEKQTVSYLTTSGGPFNIELRREKDYYEYLNGINQAKVEKSSDRLMVNLYSLTDTSKYCFKVWVTQKDSAAGFLFHDSLILGARHHKNVYECYYERPTENGLYVKGIYYTVDNGLVGYYYSDGKKWYLQ